MTTTRSHRPARTLLALTGTLAAALALGACGSDDRSRAGDAGDSGGVTVVASTDVWGDIAASVGGPDVSVSSIISDPAQDPHSFEADTGTLLTVSKADVVIENGGGYDDFMGRMTRSSKSRATVLDAVRISGRTAARGEELNEHVWYDLPSVKKVVHALADQLGRERPDRADDFDARAEALDGRIDRLIAEEAALRRTSAGTEIGITEPVPLYLTAACGLRNVTPEQFSEAVEEGDDVSPKVLADTLDLYTTRRVAALVYNEQTSGPVTERVKAAATAHAIPVVPVTETLPDGLHYVGWMQQNLSHLRAALDRS